MKTIRYTVIIAMIIILSITSCEDFVKVPSPETLFPKSKVFENDATALSALANVYSNLNRSDNFSSGGGSSISFLMGLYADELTAVSGSSTNLLEFNQNDLSPDNGLVSGMWGNCYNIIYLVNDIIEQTANSNGLSPGVQAQLEGEAKFIRAFCHFYLTNSFGNVPYITTTNYLKNTVVPQTDQLEIYERIIEDLLEAQQLLNDSYPSDGRVRPNKATVTAFLARVYLYMGDWSNAELQATIVISNSATYSLMPSDQVFIKESTEAIWQIFPPPGSNNSYDAETFVVTTTPNYSTLSDELYSAFETNDERKTNWVGTVSDGTNTFNFPFKYRVLPHDAETEYSIVLRLAEQYLIRAEAYAKQDKLTEAIADLDEIRGRAGLPLIGDTNPTISQDDLLLAISHERRVELFTEWGHRWFDLKRLNQSNNVLGAIKTSWDETDINFPIPANEILRNRNLEQNSGY